MRVGMPRTPYFIGVSGFSSILILATVTLPAILAAISSRVGAMLLHGPHHSAQKSTRTGPGARSTSASNELSVTLVGFIGFSLTRCRGAPTLTTARVRQRLGYARKPRQGVHRSRSAGLIRIKRGPSVHNSAQFTSWFW